MPEWGTMNSTSFCQHILPVFRDYLRQYPDITFYQDNAPCHRSRQTRQAMDLAQILYEHFPRYSPDLNIIEHVWNWMKDWIQVNCLNEFPGREELYRYIEHAWEAIPESFLLKLVESMPSRIQAVIEANGGHTKY